MKEDKCRKWFCRVSKTNNTQNGVFTYDFDDLFIRLSQKYDILFALHDKDQTNIHCHRHIQRSPRISQRSI